MRQGGAGITGPTVIGPAASAASISESLFTIYSREVYDNWLPNNPDKLRELPSLKHYQHSVDYLSAMYLPEEEMNLPSDNAYAPYERGIHDIFIGDPWANNICNVRDS